MSIPPLVCSTPPPPDQCDDDKDPEDFELSYRLSQEEDEDDEYNYGSFSSYNNIQTLESRSCDKKEHNVSQPVESEIQTKTEFDSSLKSQQFIVTDDVIRTNKIYENKSEEDITIEDLNLEVNEEITNTEIDNEASEIQNHNVDSSKENIHVSSIANPSQPCLNTNSVSYVGNTMEDINLATVTDQKIVDANMTEINVDSEIKVTSKAELSSIKFEESKESSTIDNIPKCLEYPPKTFETPLEDNIIDDDFRDFDDFQFASAEIKITNVVSDCDNPWENRNNTNETDFGNFTAHFEDSKCNTDMTLETKQGCSNESSDKYIPEVDNDLEDDDFGDFDDFKSSTVTETPSEVILEHSTPCQDVPVLNLQCTENEQQIMESISKVLTSIFLEEMTEPDSCFEGKLEALLGESWGHLMETDERQPYIVNWNNSLGQKTLLRALCIDSRNILFGPKWNTSMPKYAANLSVAPLQPQKPLTPSNATHSEINAEKSSSKPSTWSDPFTSDGQESCNTESDSPGVTTGPTDLDVFESAISTKSEKIYSSTLSIQPLRQINLPDTHIFTPTDSEIPRSKTIHYEPSPTVLMPQSAVSNNIKQVESISNHKPSDIVPDTMEDANEYWEFQDFKGTSETQTSSNAEKDSSIEKKADATTPDSTFPTPSAVIQTQPLQPTKVEPSMPTLNWPEPGEVKDVFDDFSDFVSISLQSSKHEGSAVSDLVSPMQTLKKDDNMSDHPKKNDTLKLSNDFDDDFNTFQSALPSTSAVTNFNINSVDTAINQTSLSQIPDFEYDFPKIKSVQSNTISFPNIIRPNEALSQTLGHNSNATEIIIKSSLPSGTQLKTNVLQPTPASFSAVNTQIQQNSGQILQPLSLESYSQINWPSPGIDLQDLSRFNPVETLQSLKSDLSVSGVSKGSSPVHTQKSNAANQPPDDDVWGDFVSSNPKQTSQPKKPPVFVDDDEWTDFISSPSVKPQNGLNTISFNVHTSSNIQKSSMQSKFSMKSNQTTLDIPALNYITPKSSNTKSYNDRHFQNL